MPHIANPANRLKLGLTVAAVASIGLGVTIVTLNAGAIGRVAARSEGLHLPDLGLLFAQPPVVVTHVAFALTALALGPAMLVSRKGAAFHRTAGWTWVALMTGTAVSSFFLIGLTGGLSYIHLMSGLTLALLPFAVHAARGHAVRRHRALMLWLFWVMLVGAALATLIPGRLMWELFFD